MSVQKLSLELPDLILTMPSENIIEFVDKLYVNLQITLYIGKESPSPTNILWHSNSYKVPVDVTCCQK